MFIDTHSHLQDPQLIDDVKDIIQKAKEHNVKKIICSSYDILSSKMAVKLSEEYDCVFATIGVHPENCEEYSNQTNNQLKQLCKSKKVIAVGEIGLDYHYTKQNKQLQKQVFENQIILADELKLPIVIHTRDAMGDTIELIRKNKKYINNGGVFHCFHGSKEILDEIIKMGFFVSYGGAITFNNARELRELVLYTPIDKLLTETDCPYMAPVPYRGTRNEPKNIDLVVQKIAEIKNISIEELEKILEQNTRNIYKI